MSRSPHTCFLLHWATRLLPICLLKPAFTLACSAALSSGSFAVRVTQPFQAITHKLSRREELYKAFIKEAAKLYADALVHEISDVSKLVGLYAMISEMRVLSPTKTIESADEVARMIVNTYRSPNKTLPELEDMVNRGAIDVLQTFSEAARQEFRRLGV